MTVTIYRRDGSDYEAIAEFSDGDWTEEPPDGMADIFIDDPDEDRLMEVFDGPNHYAVRSEDEAEKDGMTSGTSGVGQATYGGSDLPDVCRLCGNERKEGSMLCDECSDKSEKIAEKIAEKAVGRVSKKWTGPHQGPRGGTFWYNPETGEQRYQENKPEPGEGDSGDGGGGGDGGDSDGDGGSEDSGVEEYGENHDIPETNPETDIENFRNDEFAQDLVETTAKDAEEGFTLQRNLETVNVFEEDVYWTGMWSVDIPADEFSGEDVEEFYEQAREIMDQNPALHIGGWHYGDDHEKAGNVALDLSVGIADKDVAFETGQELEQEGIANLMTDDFPDTEGSGESPLDGPQEALEYKEENLPESSLRKSLIREMGKEESQVGTKTVFRNVETGKTISGHGVVHGVKYGLDVENRDGVIYINGEEYEKVEVEIGSSDDDDPNDSLDDAEKLAEKAADRLAESAVEKVLGDTGNSKGAAESATQTLTKAQYEKADDFILEMHKRTVWWDGDDLSKAPMAWDSSDDVPDFVRDVIKQVIDGNVVYNNFEGYSRRSAEIIQNKLEENLTQPQGWSVRSIVEDLQETFKGMGDTKALNIVRTELSAIFNTAREEAYKQRDDSDEYRYYWQGPNDHRTTKICEEIKDEVKREGGNVPLNELRNILRRKAKKYENTREGGTPDRVSEFTPHFKCRHTFIRDVRATL